MADKMCENNQVTIMGEIVSDFSYSHEVYGEGFYMVEVSVHRLSSFVDYIPVMVSSGQCAGECGGKMRLYYRTVPFIQPA